MSFYYMTFTLIGSFWNNRDMIQFMNMINLWSHLIYIMKSQKRIYFSYLCKFLFLLKNSVYLIRYFFLILDILYWLIYKKKVRNFTKLYKNQKVQKNKRESIFNHFLIKKSTKILILIYLLIMLSKLKLMKMIEF